LAANAGHAASKIAAAPNQIFMKPHPSPPSVLFVAAGREWVQRGSSSS
jgi:hypothetical protein